MTKPITVVAILILADRGLISVWDKVWKYLPFFAKRHNGITIRHLLTHTSGLGSEMIGQTELQKLFSNPPMTLEEAVERHSLTEAAFLPGAREAYSAVMGFDVLARIVEVV
jgi:CubicO group peptidase (beta-lactamase class C family)